MAKTWVETEITGSGTDEDPLRPDLGGYEDDPEIQYSMMDKGDGTCLARVAGPQTKISNLTAPTRTDSEARGIIQTHHPNSDLENVDVPDPELDGIAEGLGIEPLEVRRSAPITTPQALQSQEAEVFKEAAKAKGVDVSSDLPTIYEGKCSNHGSAMEKLR